MYRVKFVVVLLVVGTSCHVVTLYVQVFIVYLYPELIRSVLYCTVVQDILFT